MIKQLNTTMIERKTIVNT